MKTHISMINIQINTLTNINLQVFEYLLKKAYAARFNKINDLDKLRKTA